MINVRIPAVLILALCASCGGGSSEAGTPSAPAAKGTKKAPPAAQPADALPAGDIELDVEIVNPAEAKAAAAQEITTDNADAEFEKLKQEIESGG